MQGLRRVGGALAGVFAGVQIGQFLRGAIAEAEEAQAALAQTNAVIESTGGIAGITADHLVDLSGELSNLAAVDDEVIQQGGNLLLTFKNIRAEGGIYDDALASALDMSAAMDTQLQPNIMAVGKALNDPVAGLSRLTRMGVDFTDQQKEQIEAMVAFGDTAGAQRIILDELASQFGGAAEANATASEKMTVAWDNIKESVGTALLPAFQSAADAVAGLAEWFGALPQSTQVAILGFAGVAAAAAVMWATIGAPATAVVVGLAAIAAGAFFLGEQFPELKRKAMEFFDSLPERWAQFQKDMQPAKEALDDMITGLRKFISSLDFSSIGNSLKSIGDSLQTLKDQFGVTSSNGQIAMAVLVGAIGFVGITIQTTIMAAMQAAKALAWMGAVSMKALQWGIAMVKGFIDGATSAAKTAWKAISSLSGIDVSIPGLGSLRDLLSSAAGAAQSLYDRLSKLSNTSFTVDIPVVGRVGVGELTAAVGGASLGGSVAMATGVRGGEGNRRGLSMGSGGSETHVTLVMPDGQVLARTTVRGHRKDSRAYAGAGGGDY